MRAESTGGGLGCTGTLLLIFVVLKLTDNIDWSWWWVLSPLWAALIAGVVMISLLVWTAR